MRNRPMDGKWISGLWDASSRNSWDASPCCKERTPWISWSSSSNCWDPNGVKPWTASRRRLHARWLNDWTSVLQSYSRGLLMIHSHCNLASRPPRGMPSTCYVVCWCLMLPSASPSMRPCATRSWQRWPGPTLTSPLRSRLTLTLRRSTNTRRSWL